MLFISFVRFDFATYKCYLNDNLWYLETKNLVVGIFDMYIREKWGPFEKSNKI